MQPGQEPDGF